MQVTFSDVFPIPRQFYKITGFLPFIEMRPFDRQQLIFLIFSSIVVLVFDLQLFFYIITVPGLSFVQITQILAIMVGGSLTSYKAFNCWIHRDELRELMQDLLELFPVSEDKTKKGLQLPDFMKTPSKVLSVYFMIISTCVTTFVFFPLIISTLEHLITGLSYKKNHQIFQ